MTDRSKRRCLLISNSTNYGEGYLDHCAEALREILDGRDRLAFVPFALHDRQGYGRRAAERFATLGVEAVTLTADDPGRALLAEVPAVFVGGGNTFRLLDALQTSGLLDVLRHRARDDLVYSGASAGANIAAPTIRTTNAMPIVEPASFASLGLIGFQINPHYLDPQPGSEHMGETRQQRLEEFLEANDVPVVGLREGAWLRVVGEEIRLGGRRDARVFRRGEAPAERSPGEHLQGLEG